LLLLGLSALGRPQMAPAEVVDSLDVKVLRASNIALGNIETVETSGYRDEHRVTARVQSNLYGSPEATLVGKVRLKISDVETLRRSAPKLLFMSSPGSTALEVIDLESSRMVSRFVYSRSPAWIPVFTRDFKRLQGERAILDYVRQVLGRPRSPLQTMTIPPPPGARGKEFLTGVQVFGKTLVHYGSGGLTVPVDEVLERWAFSELSRLTPGKSYPVIQMLKPFRSERNIARLRELLSDRSYEVTLPAERYRGTELRDYLRRNVAVQVLREWQVSFQEPTTREQVSKLESIRSLLFTPEFDEPSIEWLTNARQLRKLTIPYGRLNLEHFTTIGRLTQLRELTVSRTRLDDIRLLSLVGLRELRTLNVENNPITDAGLLTIAEFPKLEMVRIGGTEVTQAGIAALRERRPKLRVITTAPEGR